jgi:hypothetical protein
MLKKKSWANFKRIELFTQEMSLSPQIKGLGSEIWDPEKTYPGSRGQKSTGSSTLILRIVMLVFMNEFLEHDNC